MAKKKSKDFSVIASMRKLSKVDLYQCRMRLHFFGVALILAESVEFVEGYRSKNVKEIFKLKN